ncbi:MAG TPA: potassium-transporting ATPase subunit KdpA [Candidatus Eisenbacteria bacterium]
MTPNGLIQILFYLVLLLLITKPLGAYLYRVMEGQDHILKRPLGWLERLVYRVCGVDGREQTWQAYAGGMLGFSAITLLVSYAIQRLQLWLPFNPQRMAAVEASSAFNTAVSFTTNTNWQGYSGEATMSYLSQMAGLAWHNFISAAAGLAIAVALARGLTRQGEGKGPGTIGNFWVDLTRATVYILLPISFLFALALASQGVIQNFSAYREVATVDGGKQVLAMGPAASQIAIKQLGTNGGGFFNSNSAHPFENPTPLSNFLELFLILMLPAAQTYMFGRMARVTRQGWALFGAMALILVVGVGSAYWAESQPNAAVASVHGVAVGPNLEGKEVRYGIPQSTLWATATTAASNGSVNSMHDSYNPLGGLVPLFNIQLGEVVFGGVGAGLYGILVMAILSVFIAGLMVGRTPEYLGKKIETREVKLVMLYVLIFPLIILGFTAWAALVPRGLSSLNNAGPHGLSEILYAFSSAAGNNGSAFAGLNANTPFYNTALGVAMLAGRFWMIIPALAIAGILAGKKALPPGPGTLPTTGPLFSVLLVAVIVIVGALTFFPVLGLGPIVEHFLALAGKVF